MTSGGGNGGGVRPFVVPVLVLGLFALAAIAMIVYSLRRPSVAGVPPTAASPVEVGDALVGPVRYTIDATQSERWAFFDFSRGSVVTSPGPTDWDLAFQRFRIIVNGGKGFAGDGAIADLGEVAFDAVRDAPAQDWVETTARSDSTNDAIAHWYAYGWTSHLLRPKPRVFAVRTADGKYAKLRLINYYCPGATPGCVTFEYVYRGDGGTSLDTPRP